MRHNIRFQLNRELSTRLVAQYNDRNPDWEVDPLLTYRINPFSVFYVGSTHYVARLTDETRGIEDWRQTSRQYFMKLQSLFRM